jgi:hypothetical protein
MTDLDDLFAQARGVATTTPQALQARVMSDALAELSQTAGPNPSPTAMIRRESFMSRLFGLFGGAGPVAGGVMAGFTGLALGYLQPESLANFTDILATNASYDLTIDLMPGYDALLTEE